jgi:hypothetical protein
MYYERLALEVSATVAGLNVVKPPIITGASGVNHKFTFVATDGTANYAFDVYPDLGQVEILRSYVKKMDTGASTYIVCLSGRPSTDALEMARCYDMDILGPGDVGDFFSKRITAQILARKSRQSETGQRRSSMPSLPSV